MSISNLSYDEALEIFGTRAEIARVLGIKHQAVYQWGSRLPRLRSYELADYVRVALHSDDDAHQGVRCRAETVLARNSDKNAA